LADVGEFVALLEAERGIFFGAQLVLVGEDAEDVAHLAGERAHLGDEVFAFGRRVGRFQLLAELLLNCEVEVWSSATDWEEEFSNRLITPSSSFAQTCSGVLASLPPAAVSPPEAVVLELPEASPFEEPPPPQALSRSAAASSKGRRAADLRTARDPNRRGRPPQRRASRPVSAL
jgi:hypothetical protein